MPSVYLPWLHYKKKGYEVDVFVLGDFAKHDFLDFQGCHIHLVPKLNIFRNNKRLSSLPLIPSLVNGIVLYAAVASAIRGQRTPDIIYTYRPCFAYIGWLMAKRYGAIFVKRFFGTFAYFEWYQRKSLKSKIQCFREFLRWLSPCDLLIVSNDGTCGDKVANLLRIRKSKFRMWLNGIDKKWFDDAGNAIELRRRLGFSREHFVLMCLSRLDGWKRQDRVIRAMKIILKDITNARLIIVGDGPKRAELEELTRNLGLQEQVKFYGMIEHNKVRDMIKVADVFLQTNDFSCLGNTLLEAIACGKVIVTWDVGTTRDVIFDDKNGCLMPNAEPETIAQTVIALAKDPGRCKRLAENAQKFAEEQLQSWDERLDMEIGLVETICAQKKFLLPVNKEKTLQGFTQSLKRIWG